MAKQIKKYVANTGIDFEQFDPPIRVEKDKPIPSRLHPDDIRDLIKAGLIRESEAENE